VTAIGAPAATRFPRLPAVAALVVIALLAGVLGGVVARASVAPRPPASAAGLKVLRTVGTDPFNRAQTATDRTEIPRGGDLVAGSVRRLADTPDVPSVLSAAKDAAGNVCLVDAVELGRQFTASCVTPAVFARQGIALQWSTSGWSAGQPFVDEGYLPRFFTVVWGPDGVVRLGDHVVGEG